MKLISDQTFKEHISSIKEFVEEEKLDAPEAQESV